MDGPTNHPLVSDDLSTFISKPPNKGTTRSTTTDANNNNPEIITHDPVLIQAFETIATMADRLGLVSTIKDRACEIYKKVEDQKSSRGRRPNQDAILAACLYLACRQEGEGRTLKEICSANGVTAREIGRAQGYITKRLEVDLGNVSPREFLRRFCSNLGMDNRAMKAAQEDYRKKEELGLRDPMSTVMLQLMLNRPRTVRGEGFEGTSGDRS